MVLVNLILSYQISRCRVKVIDLILVPIYKRIEYVPISNPEFIPLFATIVTSRYLIGQTIVGTIHWNDCYII
jgi:hypothetical protein